VNTEADGPSKLATRHRTKDGKPDVRYSAFFKALVEAIAGKEDDNDAGGLGWVNTGEALNLTLRNPASHNNAEAGDCGMQNLNLAERESALSSFVTDGWLDFHPTNKTAYSLGPRAYMELGPMLLGMGLSDGARKSLEQALGYS